MGGGGGGEKSKQRRKEEKKEEDLEVSCGRLCIAPPVVLVHSGASAGNDRLRPCEWREARRITIV